MSKYFALVKRGRDYHGPTLRVLVRPEQDVHFLLDVAQPGDELHTVPAELVHSGALVSNWVREHEGVLV